MNPKKLLLLCAGFFFSVLGMIGAFMPVMPSIPFFIIASVCFSKSSVRFHNMLLNNKLIGPHIKNYHENNGISISAKLIMLAIQWIGLFFTGMFFVHNLLGRLLLLMIALAATGYVLSLKTVKGKAKIGQKNQL